MVACYYLVDFVLVHSSGGWVACLLSSPPGFNSHKVDMLARCDKARRVDAPWDRGSTPVGFGTSRPLLSHKFPARHWLAAVGTSLGVIVAANRFEPRPRLGNPGELSIPLDMVKNMCFLLGGHKFKSRRG
jgi:hypothetical protein